MTFAILYRYKAEAWDARQVGVRLLTLFKHYEELLTKELEEVTAGFKHHKPVFFGQRGYRGGDIFCKVGTNDAIFFYLNEGTDIRYATMVRGFERKTDPNSFKTYPGWGGVWFISTNRPRPGIEPRNWTRLLTQKYSRIFLFDVTRETMKGIKARKLVGGGRFVGG